MPGYGQGVTSEALAPIFWLFVGPHALMLFIFIVFQFGSFVYRSPEQGIPYIIIACWFIMMTSLLVTMITGAIKDKNNNGFTVIKVWFKLLFRKL